MYDQYLNFVSLEEDFFITRQQNTKELSYYGKKERKKERKKCEGWRSELISMVFSISVSAMNRTGASDSDIQSVCNTLVESLFSVFVTAGESINAGWC